VHQEGLPPPPGSHQRSRGQQDRRPVADERQQQDDVITGDGSDGVEVSPLERLVHGDRDRWSPVDDSQDLGDRTPQPPERPVLGRLEGGHRTAEPDQATLLVGDHRVDVEPRDRGALRVCQHDPVADPVLGGGGRRTDGDARDRDRTGQRELDVVELSRRGGEPGEFRDVVERRAGGGRIHRGTP